MPGYDQEHPLRGDALGSAQRANSSALGASVSEPFPFNPCSRLLHALLHPHHHAHNTFYTLLNAKMYNCIFVEFLLIQNDVSYFIFLIFAVNKVSLR